MKCTKPFLFTLIPCFVSSAQAALPPQLDPPLNNLIIYSSAAITMGASSVVGGNIQVEAAATIGASSTVSGYIITGAAVTLGATVKVGGYIEARDAGTIGADSTVGGYLTTGDAATLGATTIDGNIIVGGDLTAGAAIQVGTKAVINGNVRSGASASTDFGANTIVNGNAIAGTALTLGATVTVGGNAQAGTGAVALGELSIVAGDATAGTTVTVPASASVGGNITEGEVVNFPISTKQPIDDQSPQLEALQAELAAMQAPAANQLPTSMTVSTTLTKGVYHTTALTTTAGITITFDGENEDGHWLINSDTFIAFGANTIIVLKDVTANSTITWNAGGYISAGASVNLIGTFFAGSYILAGASITLEGIGDHCGGFFTTTGAVTLGASNLIGPLDCKVKLPTPLVEYHFDEASWNGTNGEVTDNSTSSGASSGNNSGNSLNGNAVGNATTITSGQVCRAGTFDGTGDYINVTGIDSYLNSTASLSFWIKSSQGGSNTAWQAPGIIGIEQRGGGNDIFWGYVDASGHIRIQKGNGRSASSSTRINNDRWHHIVLTRDSSTGVVQIFVNGQLEDSANSARGDVSTRFSSIGRIENSFSNENFSGQLDELLVFASVISPNDVNAIYTNQLKGNNYDGSERTCPVAVIHHYEISHDGQGLTCDIETVTVKACTDSSCSMLSTESVTLDFMGNNTLINTKTFTGSTTIDFNNTNAETLTLSVANATATASNSIVCDDGDSASCDIIFTNAGFRFLYGANNDTTLPNQTSGLVFDEILKLQAVKDIDGVCSGLFNDNKNVDLSQENVEPGGNSGLRFSINMNNTDINKHPNTTNTALNFGADSIATIPTPSYHDAGQIRLHANYEVDGITLLGSSNSFWVSPAKLVISARSKPEATTLNGATAATTTTYAAGKKFDLTITAYNAATPSVITPNYSPGQIQFKLSRIGPSLMASVDGDLTYSATTTMLTSSTTPVFQNVTLSNFSSGVSTYNAAQYSEVGLIKLAVQDSDYGNVNITIPATAINMGRFIPYYFTQTIADNGHFHATCDSRVDFSAYSGQKDEATDSIGAITYLTNPVLAITAYNKQGTITQNYYEDSQGSANDYMKLNNSSINITKPILDQVATGVDGSILSLTANMYYGNLSQNDLTTSVPSDNPLPKGVLHYQLSDNDNFFYNRSANALVAPFSSDINFSTATIKDGDEVNVTTTVDASPTGVEIKFGRLLLENSFGPETSHLPQPMQVEHFDGSSFIVTTDNNCSTYDASNITLTDISLDPLFTETQGLPGIFLNGETLAIKLKAPGAGNQGQIGVSYDTYDWLKYDWDNNGAYNDNPSATATFGIFRGNDRIIYWREIYK